MPQVSANARCPATNPTTTTRKHVNVKLQKDLALFLADNELPKLSSKPDLRGFQQILIEDARPVDGDRVDAWFNAKTREVYKEVTGSGFGGPEGIGPFWYGPATVPAIVPGQVSVSRAKQAARDLDA